MLTYPQFLLSLNKYSGNHESSVDYPHLNYRKQIHLHESRQYQEEYQIFLLAHTFSQWHHQTPDLSPAYSAVCYTSLHILSHEPKQGRTQDFVSVRACVKTYNGGLRAGAPKGRGTAPGQGVRRQSSLKAVLLLNIWLHGKFASFSFFCKPNKPKVLSKNESIICNGTRILSTNKSQVWNCNTCDVECTGTPIVLQFC